MTVCIYTSFGHVCMRLKYEKKCFDEKRLMIFRSDTNTCADKILDMRVVYYIFTFSNKKSRKPKTEFFWSLKNVWNTLMINLKSVKFKLYKIPTFEVNFLKME